MALLVYLFPLLFTLSLFAESSLTEFRADHFSRDLLKNRETGKGRAYLKRLDREVWADEIEFNLAEDTIIATGNVHMRLKGVDLYCSKGTYSLKEDTATLDEATLIAGQMLVTGEVMHKLSADHYEVKEGFYTNCNNDRIKDPSVSNCIFDWKIYARRFDITIEEYLHMYDTIIYGKGIPIAYLPYYIAPAKTKRASGFLLASIINVQDLGVGYRLPYYQVLGSWHDLTIQPTRWSSNSTHLGLDYRYTYSSGINGEANVFLTDRSLSLDRNAPRKSEENKPKIFGIIGEYALNITHTYSLGKKFRSRQSLRYVSDPYYPLMYTDDLGGIADFSYLRSQITASYPTDNYLFAGAASGYQSLILSKSSGRDLGPVSQSPSLVLSQKATPLLPPFLSYSVDTRFSNYSRSARAYDSIPETVPTDRAVPSAITNNDFHGNDYLREGRRLQIEPRLVANVPLATGFQFQPALKAGELLYHFDLPNSTFVNREYIDFIAPFSMYLSRVYPTTIKGFEEVKHILQPRAIYATSIYRSDEPKHPFFYRPAVYDANAFSNPRFDIIDQITDHEYFRLELSNRLLRQTEDATERFFLLEVASQYNSKTSPYDPRFKGHLGPLEVTTALNFSPIALNLQGTYALESTKRPDGSEDVHEADWTGSLSFEAASTALSLGSTLHTRADPNYDEMVLNFSGSQKLPIYVQLGGSFEYSAKKGEFRSYGFNINLAQRPLSCWQLLFNLTRAPNGIITSKFTFQLNLGGPLGFSSGEVKSL